MNSHPNQINEYYRPPSGQYTNSGQCIKEDCYKIVESSFENKMAALSLIALCILYVLILMQIKTRKKW
jgi:hypothetical protein